MKRLAELLAGPRQAVIYRIHPDHPFDDIAKTVAEAGWHLVHLNTNGAADKGAVMEQVRSAFGFPDWFGGNLDALVDSLRDVEHQPGTVLLWDHSHGFADNDEVQFDKVLDVLVDRASTGEPAAFVTLLRD